MSIQIGPLLIGLAVFGASLGLLLLVFFLARQVQAQKRSRQVVERLSQQPAGASEPGATPASDGSIASTFESFGRWLEKKRLSSGEDARLLLQAGFRQKGAPYIFTAIRFALPVALAVLTLFLARLWDVQKGTTLWPALVAVAIVGYLIPKFVLESLAANRRDALNAELPFFVDMLALLQGVGLSQEQSLFALGQAPDLGLPVISTEMRELNRQIAAGRPRLEALQRMADVNPDEDLRELIAMLRQIDRYGGDVANALRDFSTRLQQKRQTALREKAGKANVKMTAVMIFANFPALLLITAGPAVLALLHFFDTLG